MVAVVGVSASSQAQLLATIDSLGTNLLTVSPGTTFTGANEVLPDTAVAMIGHMGNVNRDAAVYQVPTPTSIAPRASRRRRPAESGSMLPGVNLPQVMGAAMSAGHFLDAVSSRYPEAVLGAEAAQVLQITRVGGHVMVYLGNTWFTVVGIMRSAVLDTTLDSTVFISLPVAERIFPSSRTRRRSTCAPTQNDVTGVSNLLAATADPRTPAASRSRRPSDVLEARAAAKGQFTTLLLGLGAVALLVGAIGIANIMVISVLERRGEIGLRRALGATRRHISLQFLTESAVLAALGSLAGLVLGAGATEAYRSPRTSRSSSRSTRWSPPPPPAC